MGRWILGAVVGVVGLVALLLASHAQHGAMYDIGLLVFALCVLAILAMIVRATGQPPRTDDLDPAQP